MMKALQERPEDFILGHGVKDPRSGHDGGVDAGAYRQNDRHGNHCGDHKIKQSGCGLLSHINDSCKSGQRQGIEIGDIDQRIKDSNDGRA